jgi:F-type H+-transporting ATPase subunit c
VLIGLKESGGNMRLLSYVAVLCLALVLVVDPAFAEGANPGSDMGWINPLTAGFALAIAAFGGALGQSKIISSALESISRNPGAAGAMFTPWLLGVAFVESLVLFTFVLCWVKLTA